jgi:hypothetical protein
MSERGMREKPGWFVNRRARADANRAAVQT